MALDAKHMLIYNKVIEYLRQIKFVFDTHPSEGVITFNYESEQLLLHCRSNRVTVYVNFPADIPEASRPAIAKYIAQLNQKIAFGNWELNMDLGKLKYKTYISFSGMPNFFHLLLTCVSLGTDTYKLEKQNIAILLAALSVSGGGGGGGGGRAASPASRAPPILEATRNGDEATVRQLIASRANVNQTDDQGISPLIAAANRGNVTICDILLRARANINHESNNRDTPLSMACFKNQRDVALMLIRAGADVHHVDKFGETPLHDAAKNGMLEVVRALIAKGARSSPNNKGETPLGLAVEKGHMDVAQALAAAA